MIVKQDDYTIEFTKVGDMYFCNCYSDVAPLGQYWLSEVEYNYLINKVNKDFYMCLVFLDAIKKNYLHMCKQIRKSYEV